MVLRKIKIAELKKILEKHEEWVETNGADGSCVNLRNANLQGASLENANLQGASLENANLQGASLENANLQGASLENANLMGASLWGANLGDANLRDANLMGTSLRDANLRDANLMGAKIKYGILTEAVITLTLSYWVLVSEFHVQIGCKQFLHVEFLKLTESDAKKIDGDKAVMFYKNYRPLIVAAIEIYKEN